MSVVRVLCVSIRVREREVSCTCVCACVCERESVCVCVSLIGVANSIFFAKEVKNLEDGHFSRPVKKKGVDVRKSVCVSVSEREREREKERETMLRRNIFSEENVFERNQLKFN